VNGAIMSSWNPLTSPYPFSRASLTPISGFPSWNPAPLLAIQRSRLLDTLNR
jgi:hypothetical protein